MKLIILPQSCLENKKEKNTEQKGQTRAKEQIWQNEDRWSDGHRDEDFRANMNVKPSTEMTIDKDKQRIKGDDVMLDRATNNR